MPSPSFPGARFYKSDLHIHTPASKCWKDSRNKNMLRDIFEKIKSEGLEVVAITDHNSVGGVDEARRIAKSFEVVVFPGVEVTTKEGHVIAIFDPNTHVAEMDDWLTRLAGR